MAHVESSVSIGALPGVVRNLVDDLSQWDALSAGALAVTLDDAVAVRASRVHGVVAVGGRRLRWSGHVEEAGIERLVLVGDGSPPVRLELAAGGYDGTATLLFRGDIGGLPAGSEDDLTTMAETFLRGVRDRLEQSPAKTLDLTQQDVLT